MTGNRQVLAGGCGRTSGKEICVAGSSAGGGSDMGRSLYLLDAGRTVVYDQRRGTAGGRDAGEPQRGIRKGGADREFLNRKIPENWDALSVAQRKQFFAGGLHLPEGTDLVERSKVCAMEIWVECFNGDVKHLKKTDSMEINSILASIKGWKRNKSMRRYGPHGAQKGFERV